MPTSPPSRWSSRSWRIRASTWSSAAGGMFWCPVIPTRLTAASYVRRRSARWCGGSGRTRDGWEIDGDVQSAIRPGMGGERGAVRLGDGGDDGQPEAVAVAVVGTVGAEALER